METVGFIGVGKIGLPVCENLIKSGYKVLGYRRGSLADFEKVGGTPAKSPAEIGKQCNVVFSCVPTPAAMDEVVNGANGLIHVGHEIACTLCAERIRYRCLEPEYRHGSDRCQH